jgi:glucosamine--fructose-6-phosphate aminotransferase (isomerizing)
MSAYQADILAQSAALQDTLETLGAARPLVEIRQGLQSGRWRRIILTGMGSSYFTLLPLYQRLLEAGLAAWLFETSELIYSNAILAPDTLIIAASQSGASVETVRLLDKIGPGYQVIGLTNTPDSPLARRASFTVLTMAGEEATVSCKTYLASLAAQCWLGDQLIQGQNEFSGLQGLSSQVQAYLDGWQAHVAELKRTLAGVEQVYLTGRGISIASAGTGGLILKESVHVASEGMSSAGFRHGPFEMVRTQTFVVIFAGCSETVALNRKLYSDVAGVGGRAALVEAGAGAGAFGLPLCPEAALPILEILPVQMMTLALAELRHLTAGSFSLASKVTTTE